MRWNWETTEFILTVAFWLVVGGELAFLAYPIFASIDPFVVLLVLRSSFNIVPPVLLIIQLHDFFTELKMSDAPTTTTTTTTTGTTTENATTTTTGTATATVTESAALSATMRELTWAQQLILRLSIMTVVTPLVLLSIMSTWVLMTDWQFYRERSDPCWPPLYWKERLSDAGVVFCQLAVVYLTFIAVVAQILGKYEVRDTVPYAPMLLARYYVGLARRMMGSEAGR